MGAGATRLLTGSKKEAWPLEGLDPQEKKLHLAALKGQFEEVEKLLKKSPGEVNSVEEVTGNSVAHVGVMDTPDRLMCLHAVLQDSCVNPNIVNMDNMTPLTLAITRQNLPAVKMLLADIRVDPNKQRAGVKSPMHIAAEQGLEKAMRMLLACSRLDPNQQFPVGGVNFTALAMLAELHANGTITPDQEAVRHLLMLDSRVVRPPVKVPKTPPRGNEPASAGHLGSPGLLVGLEGGLLTPSPSKGPHRLPPLSHTPQAPPSTPATETEEMAMIAQRHLAKLAQDEADAEARARGPQPGSSLLGMKAKAGTVQLGDGRGGAAAPSAFSAAVQRDLDRHLGFPVGGAAWQGGGGGGGGEARPATAAEAEMSDVAKAFMERQANTAAGPRRADGTRAVNWFKEVEGALVRTGDDEEGILQAVRESLVRREEERLQREADALEALRLAREWIRKNMLTATEDEMRAMLRKQAGYMIDGQVPQDQWNSLFEDGDVAAGKRAASKLLDAAERRREAEKRVKEQRRRLEEEVELERQRRVVAQREAERLRRLSEAERAREAAEEERRRAVEDEKDRLRKLEEEEARLEAIRKAEEEMLRLWRIAKLRESKLARSRAARVLGGSRLDKKKLPPTRLA